MIPDLLSKVVILDRKNYVVASLGEGNFPKQIGARFEIRRTEHSFPEDLFVRIVPASILRAIFLWWNGLKQQSHKTATLSLIWQYSVRSADQSNQNCIRKRRAHEIPHGARCCGMSNADARSEPRVRRKFSASHSSTSCVRTAMQPSIRVSTIGAS